VLCSCHVARCGHPGGVEWRCERQDCAPGEPDRRCAGRRRHRLLRWPSGLPLAPTWAGAPPHQTHRRPSLPRPEVHRSDRPPQGEPCARRAAATSHVDALSTRLRHRASTHCSRTRGATHLSPVWKTHLHRPTPPRQGGVIGHGQRPLQKRKRRTHAPLGAPVGQVKDFPKDQHRLNRLRTGNELSPALGRPSSAPVFQPILRHPDGQRTPLDQCRVVFRPVANMIYCLAAQASRLGFLGHIPSLLDLLRFLLFHAPKPIYSNVHIPVGRIMMKTQALVLS